ncbi:MAG TPA: GNAT family N-acetyltransferase [Polyangiales bacterium]
MTIEIRQHTPGRDLADFIRVPYLIFQNDPNWIPPLDFMVKEQLTPSKNAFFEHAEVALFTARKNGQLVGRISAQVDQEHLKRWNDEAGFFGFFDTIDDPEVGKALMAAAESWLRQRGVKKIRGPMSLSVNEELGTLVEGFDTPAMLMMSHHRPYQGAIVEACGLTKVKDLFCWRYDMDELPPRAQKAYDEIKALPEVKLRTLNPKNLEPELKLILEIQDDAWRDNWGHVSLTATEGKKAVEALKLVVKQELAILAEIDGKPAGMCIALPNLNEAARDLGGKLFPLGWAKLLYRLKVKTPSTARLCLLGIKKEYRSVRRYGALSLAMVAEIQQRGRKLGVSWGELSWTLEDNAPVNLLIRSMRGKLYKKYRVYERAL